MAAKKSELSLERETKRERLGLLFKFPYNQYKSSWIINYNVDKSNIKLKKIRKELERKRKKN